MKISKHFPQNRQIFGDKKVFHVIRADPVITNQETKKSTNLLINLFHNCFLRYLRKIKSAIYDIPP